MNLPTPKKPEEEKKTEKEKIEERREEVLKSGRKFKYPLQYSKHKLIIITIAVAITGLHRSQMIYLSDEEAGCYYRMNWRK